MINQVFQNIQTHASFLAYLHGGLRKGAWCMICQKSPLLLIGSKFKIGIYKQRQKGFFAYNHVWCCLTLNMTLVPTYVLKKALTCLTQHSGTSSRTFKRIYEPEDWQFFNLMCEFVSHTGTGEILLL